MRSFYAEHTHNLRPAAMYPLPLPRRQFISATATGAGLLLLPDYVRGADQDEMPADNPAAGLDIPWTDNIEWRQTLDITTVDGKDWADKLDKAQTKLRDSGGGVVYFPAGTYRFDDHIKLQDGVVLRGANPPDATKAHDEKYAPPTKFEFPKYSPILKGDGTPIDTAFKGIHLDNPQRDSLCGIVNIDIHRGHVHFGETDNHECGGQRIVYGCVLRNAAVADANVPDVKFQETWQRFTARHHAAIEVVGENVLVANNRLPKSGDENFAMNGYVMLDRKKQPVKYDGVVFDYDNRPGMYINHYCVGGSGGSGDDGTPDTHPYGFRKGTVIRDNYIYNTGRIGIGFAGDGTICANNIIRLEKDVWRPTVTGLAMTHGSSTNDNRAIEMRGWRWTVDGNDYVVHRNWAAEKSYLINDGEGLMHEDHCNSDIRDSRLTNNKGNAYLSIYKCGSIDGLLVEGNEISVDQGVAIMVVSNRNSGPAPCKNVTIAGNTTTGGGILIAGSPAENNVVKNNRHVGKKGNVLRNEAKAKVSGNVGFEVENS